MTSISDERLAEMLAAAERATPGPWSSVEGHSRIAIDGPKDKSIGLIGMTDYWDRFSAEDQANAAHIANCDPGTIAALISELQALRRTSHEGVREWRPIATAPKDGTTILCYFPLEGLDAGWCRTVPVFFDDREGRGWIFASRAASGFSRGYEPTHWQPLPSPPALSPNKEDEALPAALADGGQS